MEQGQLKDERIHLTKGEWVETYHALDSNLDEIEETWEGRGCRRDEAVVICKMYLRNIMRKIGDEGGVAHQCGTAGKASRGAR